MSSWKPNLDDTFQPIPTQNLLRKAVWKLYNKKIIMNPSEVLNDAHGVYGYRYPQFLVVAKKELYGNILSFHEQAVLKARMHRIGILCWLNSAKKFYLFDPVKVDKEGKRNMKGQSVMINVNISMGKDPGL